MSLSKPRLSPTLLLSVLAASLAVQLASAAEDQTSIENITRELSTLRQEIGQLHDEINHEKQVFNDQMRSLANQRSDLEVRISRQQLNLQDLERELASMREARAEQNLPDEQLTPMILDTIRDLRRIVSESLPFRLQDRLAVIDGIESKLRTQAITANKATNQLWAFVEDELAMGKTSGIHNETLEIAGTPQLARVLRLGKLAMFYTLPDGGYGLVRKDAGSAGWQHQSVTGKDDIALVNQLFDAYAKNIRTGLFVVPNPLPRK